ncbi:MAG: shikimate dehydrogenase [bacterium]|nr:shikimate dehydrogenase [bacterium]
MNGHTKIFGVAGFPVSHTLSPVIHNDLFKRYGINSIYLPLEIAQERFKDFVQGLRSINNLVGLNITVPYKETILPYLDEISPDARLIGAVNTVLVSKSRLKGYNSDWYGFSSSMKINFPRFRLKNSRVLLLGAGGGSKAVSFALLRSGIRKLVLVDIIHEKARQLKKHLLRYNGKTEIIVEDKGFASLSRMDLSPDLIINATPQGLKQGDKPVISLKPIAGPKTVVYDLIYNPRETALLRSARQMGLAYVNGLDMLILQALRSFSIWTRMDLEKGLAGHLSRLRKQCS